MTQPLTHAERKRQQRARAAAGQVHRVAVYLTAQQAALAIHVGCGDPALGLIRALTLHNTPPRQTAPAQQ